VVQTIYPPAEPPPHSPTTTPKIIRYCIKKRKKRAKKRYPLKADLFYYDFLTAERRPTRRWGTEPRLQKKEYAEK